MQQFLPLQNLFLALHQWDLALLPEQFTVTGCVLAAAQTDNSFDVQLCGRQGRRGSRGVGKSSSARSSWLHKCSSETLPQWWKAGLSARGQAEFPCQRGQRGPGGTSQRPCVQLCPECDTVASASLPLISEGRVGHDSIAKCEMGRWEGERMEGGGSGARGADHGNFFNKAIVFQGGGTRDSGEQKILLVFC